eukprot:9098447-Pyramimonas_sp.AAC.1
MDSRRRPPANPAPMRRTGAGVSDIPAGAHLAADTLSDSEPQLSFHSAGQQGQGSHVAADLGGG